MYILCYYVTCALVPPSSCDGMLFVCGSCHSLLRVNRDCNTILSYSIIHDVPVPGPGMPSVSVVTTTATSITLSWSVPSGSMVTSYEVMWQRDTSVGCSNEDEDSRTINTNSISTAYTISGLEEDSLYRITVIAVNSIASIVSETVTAVTEEAGKR